MEIEGARIKLRIMEFLGELMKNVEFYGRSFNWKSMGVKFEKG